MRTLFIAAIALCSSTFTLCAAEKTVVGTVKAVDSTNHSITVGDVELDVTRKSQITVDGRKAGLEAVTTGQPVTVTYDDALEVAISIVVGEGSNDDEGTSSDIKALQGEWRCIAGEENGKALEQDKVNSQRRRLIVERNSMTMDKVGGTWVGKFDINAVDGHFDWIGKAVPGNNLVEWIGIYKLTENELTLCFIFNKEDKAKRPSEFKSLPPSQPGLPHAMYTFERVAD